MKGTLKIAWQAAVVVLGLACFAAAGNINITFASSANGFGGPVPGNNVYYYPYYLTASGTNGGYTFNNQTLTVACDDYFNEVYLGETWQATLETGSNIAGGNLSGTLFGTATLNGLASGITSDKLAYEADFYLFSQLGSNTDINAAINFAMWDMFNNGSYIAPGVDLNGSNQQQVVTMTGSGSQPACTTAANSGPTSGCSDLTSGYWLYQAEQLADGGFAGMNFSDFYVLTPVAGSEPNGDGMPQEYIGEVPEASTMVLLLSGLVGLALLDWRRRWSSVSIR